MYTLTNYYKLRLKNYRPNLSSERVPHRDKTATFGQQVISAHKFQRALDTVTH
jgi:hypothetical protein